MKIKRIITAFLATAIATTAIASLSITASADEIPADTGVAFISYTNGNPDDISEQWNVGDLDGSVNATITADGSYTVSAPINGSSESIAFLALQTDLVMDNHEGMNITVDSLTIGDKNITYTGPSEGAYKMDKGVRVNIFNEWGNDVRDIDNKIALEAGQKIEITFTVTGFKATGSDSTSSPESTTETSSSSTTETTSSTTATTTSSSSSSSSSSTTSTTKAATTTKATDTTTKTASGTPSTGNAGVAGIIALAGLATGIAAFSRKK